MVFESDQPATYKKKLIFKKGIFMSYGVTGKKFRNIKI